jgi:hypothetical protein
MIRQAHTYLVGALSGVVVIGIAIAAFVVLVSAQVFHDLPIPALSSSDQKAAAVSQGKALSSPDRAVATTGGVSTGTTQPDHATANANAADGGRAGANNSQPPANHQANPAPTQDATAPAEVVETSSGDGGDQGSSTSTNGGDSGSHNSQPSTSHQPSSSPDGGSGGGGNATSTSGTSGNGGSGGGAPTTTSGSSGGGTATGTSSAPPATPVTTAKPSETITESVNGAVGTVDEATGGALSEGGVTPVVEEAVNNAAGPESVVGKTVDEVGQVVGGLVGSGGQ